MQTFQVAGNIWLQSPGGRGVNYEVVELIRIMETNVLALLSDANAVKHDADLLGRKQVPDSFQR